jgi:hypothetical protein
LATNLGLRQVSPIDTFDSPAQHVELEHATQPMLPSGVHLSVAAACKQAYYRPPMTLPGTVKDAIARLGNRLKKHGIEVDLMPSPRDHRIEHGCDLQVRFGTPIPPTSSMRSCPRPTAASSRSVDR